MMYRSTRARSVFTASEAISTRECIMDQSNLGVPAKHSAGQKSGAVPDTPAGQAKPSQK